MSWERSSAILDRRRRPWRLRSSGSCASAPSRQSHRILRDRIRSVHRSRAGQSLPRRALRSGRIPAWADRHHRERRRSGGLPLVGRYYDRLYRKDPARALTLIGIVVLPVAVLTPIQYFMPNAVLWAVFSVPVVVLLLTAFSMVGPVLTSVAPYRLRGMVGAVGGIYVFFVGATGGAVWRPCWTASSGCGRRCSSSSSRRS